MTTMQRRRLARASISFAAVLISLAGRPTESADSTQAWIPRQPVRVIVPFQAGGPIDTVARTLSRHLSDAWSQSFVVENRTGAGGNIGMDMVAKSPPDGYTLGMASGGTHGANPALFGSKMPFDPVKDFTGIALLTQMRNVLVVHPSLKVGNLEELVAYAKMHPGQVSFGSAGTGTVQHLTGEMLKVQERIDIVHVNYRGQAQAIPDLLSGRIAMMFLSAGDAAQYIRSGALIPIGLSSPARSYILPDVVPLAEQGLPGFDAVTWFGLVAPAGVPDQIVSAYFREIEAGLKRPDVALRFQQLGLDIVMMPSKPFESFIAGEVDKWGAVVKSVGIHVD